MIEATELTKRYGATLALDRLNLQVPPGTVFGLLGPNGSGKTTFLKLLMGFIFPDGGRLQRGQVMTCQMGYLPERPVPPPRSRIVQYVRLIGQLGGLHGPALNDAVQRRLEQVGLEQVAHNRVGSCSKGMLQRLALAVALMNDPPLLVLDEPMEGLDPAWQKAIRDLIVDLNRQGKTVLLSTHRLSDVVAVCSHVAILHQGRLRRAGTLSEVLPLRSTVVIRVSHMPGDLGQRLEEMHPLVAWQDDTITLQGDALSLKPLILRRLLNAEIDIMEMSQQRSTLEDVYLEAIGS